MKTKFNLRTVNVTRYISFARRRFFARFMEADDDFKYVLIQRRWSRCKALIAELIGGEIARVFSYRSGVVYANLDGFWSYEADEEIQDLRESRFKFSLHFLSGAINFDPVVTVVDSKRLPKLYG
jgi:hypothetical protein